MEEQNIIDLESITVSYDKRNKILNNINLQVKKGEILGVLGPSGSGKTTLIKTIIGMIKPKEGKVKVFNSIMPSLEVIKKIGFMAQSDALYEDLTASDNLLFFGELYGLKGKKAKKRADEILELINLKGHRKKKVSEFSGGMKRRLSLGIALFHNPYVLILDEPTVGIDPVLRREFWDEFERLKERGVTIIITTHVMDEAEHCDRLALIREGDIIALDSPTNLKAISFSKNIEESFLYFAKLERGKN